MTLRIAALAALALSLAMPSHAQMLPAAPADEVQAPLPDMPMMPMAPMGPPPGVRKITDGALTCEQIYAESRSLEDSIATHHTASEAAQREAAAAQEAMMDNAGGGAGVQAAGLLGMIPVPGAGMVGGMAAQAAMSAQMSAIQESTAKMTASYQRMAQAQQQLAYAQARNDHLIGLFLEKKCKLPEGAAKP